MNGQIVDGLKKFYRYPSKKVMASWSKDIYLIDTDAGKVRVRDTGGHKPVLLMVPDGPCVIEHFNTLISETRDNFRVVCFDMIGFGFSYPKLSYDFSINKSVCNIIHIMDALGIDRATLSFTCINGHIAIAVAKKYPERVVRLVLGQTPSIDVMQYQWVNYNIPNIFKVPYLGQLINVATSKKITSIWYEKMSLPKESPHKEGFTACALKTLDTGGCNCLASLVQGMMRADGSELNNIEVPATMVWGNQDRSHRHTDFASIREHLPMCEIVEFDNCGHYPNLEQPKVFSELLKSYQ